MIEEMFSKEKKINIENKEFNVREINDNNIDIYVNKKSINLIGEKSIVELRNKINNYNIMYSFALKEFEISKQDIENMSYFVTKYTSCLGDEYTYEELKEKRKDKKFLEKEEICKQIKRCINFKYKDLVFRTAKYDILKDLVDYQIKYNMKQKTHKIIFLKKIPCKCYKFVYDYVDKLSKTRGSDLEYFFFDGGVEYNYDFSFLKEMYNVSTKGDKRFVLKYDLNYLIITKLKIFKECVRFLYIRTLYDNKIIKEPLSKSLIELKYKENDTIEKFLSLSSNPFKVDKAENKYYDGVKYLLDKYSELTIVDGSEKATVISDYYSAAVTIKYVDNFYGTHLYTENIILDSSHLGFFNFRNASDTSTITTLKNGLYDKGSVSIDVLQRKKEIIESKRIKFFNKKSSTIYYLGNGCYINSCSFFITNNLKLSNLYLTNARRMPLNAENQYYNYEYVKNFDNFFAIYSYWIIDSSLSNGNSKFSKLKKIQKTEFHKFSFYHFEYLLCYYGIENIFTNFLTIDGKEVLLDEDSNDIKDLTSYSIDFSNVNEIQNIFNKGTVICYMNNLKKIKIYTSDKLEKVFNLFKGMKDNITNDSHALETIFLSNVKNVYMFQGTSNGEHDGFSFSFSFGTEFENLLVNYRSSNPLAKLEFNDYNNVETNNKFDLNTFKVKRNGWIGPSLPRFYKKDNLIDFSEYDLFGAKEYPYNELRKSGGYLGKTANRSMSNKISLSKLDYSSIYRNLNVIKYEAIENVFSDDSLDYSKINLLGKRFNPLSFYENKLVIEYIFLGYYYYNSKSDWYDNIHPDKHDIKYDKNNPSGESEPTDQEKSIYKEHFIKLNEECLRRLPLFYYSDNRSLQHDYAHYKAIKAIMDILIKIKEVEKKISKRTHSLNRSRATKKEIMNDSKIIKYNNEKTLLWKEADKNYFEVYYEERSILESAVFIPNKAKNSSRIDSVCNECYEDVNAFYKTRHLIYIYTDIFGYSIKEEKLKEIKNGTYNYNLNANISEYNKLCKEKRKIFINGYIPSLPKWKRRVQHKFVEPKEIN